MMKITTLFLATLVLAQGLTLAHAATGPDATDTYRIQPGDVLEVSVWKEEDLLKQVLVRPDGGISFPLVGNVQAAGKSVEDIQAVITKKLARYIPDPVVSVAIQQLLGNKIYVIGKVARPGEFVATHYMDVVQALSLAGGMTPYASDNKISILRRNNGKLISIPFRYGDIEKGENLQQNIILQSGDVVLVP
jgi:polysaccharide export outer membrane protein